MNFVVQYAFGALVVRLQPPPPWPPRSVPSVCLPRRLVTTSWRPPETGRASRLLSNLSSRTDKPVLRLSLLPPPSSSVLSKSPPGTVRRWDILGLLIIIANKSLLRFFYTDKTEYLFIVDRFLITMSYDSATSEPISIKCIRKLGTHFMLVEMR